MRYIFNITLASLMTVSICSTKVAQAQDSQVSAKTDAASLGLIELNDDLSRQQLFGQIIEADKKGSKSDIERAKSAFETFSLVGPFRFPGDTTYDSNLNQPRLESHFGVDISHHTDTSFPIELLKVRNVQFLYMKATQGELGLDGKFATFWKRAGDLPKGSQVHRGPYHFLSACRGDNCKNDPAAWGKLQAATFIRVIKANGGLLDTDMPPAVDLEWDQASATSPDRWQKRSPKEIMDMVDAFITEVNNQFHRPTVIYTAQSWWAGRIGTMSMPKTINESPKWLADYSKSSRASETPRSIEDAKWVMWQFTASSTMSTGFKDGFDANVYKGSLPALYQLLGVKEFGV